MSFSPIEILFFVTVTIQLIYWLIWLIGISSIKSTNNSNTEHGVSVVIASNNGLDNLKQLLPLLLTQSYPLFEIIIVDDRSSDGSYDYLLDQSTKHNDLKLLTVSVLPDHLNGKKYALTLGIKAAKYDQVLLTDADCKPISENWISAFASSWKEKTSFVLGFSSYEKRAGLLNYFIRFETILTGIQYLASAAIGKPYMGVGRNLSYSKTLFLSKKGFHGFQSTMGGDDDLFVNKYASGSNSNVLLQPESTIASIPKTTVKDFIVQKTRHLSVGKHYSLKSKVILASFTLTWILTWSLLPIEVLLTQNLLLPGILLLSRYILMGITFLVFSNKSGAKLNLLGLMLLDFMFVLYYFVTSIRTLFIKRVKWN